MLVNLLAILALFLPPGRNIYVSSSTGIDTNTGLSIDSPVQTIAKGKSLLRDNTNDVLLLKGNDSWKESLGQWKLSGLSASSPMLVDVYGGGEAAYLETGNSHGIFTMGGGDAPPFIHDVLIRHIVFTGSNQESNGVNFIRSCRNVTIESCFFENYFNGIVVFGYDGRHSNITIRDCVVVDSYAPTGNAQGLYVAQTDGMTVDGCVFEHNGWGPGSPPSIFKHNIYVADDNTNVTVRNSLISNGSSHGLQMRSGGVVDGCIFSRNSIALHCGGGLTPVPGGVDIVVRNNIILDAKNITPEAPRGWGMTFSNIRSGVVEGNYLTNNTNGTMAIAIDINNTTLPVTNLVFRRNTMYNWNGTLLFLEGNNFTGLTFVDNVFRDNTCLIRATDLASPVFSGNTFYSQNATPFVYQGSPITFAQWTGVANDSGTIWSDLEFQYPNRTLATYATQVIGARNYPLFMLSVMDGFEVGEFVKIKRYIINGFKR